MRSEFFVFLALFLLTLTSLALGDALIRLLPARKWAGSERGAVAFLAGAGTLSLIIFALSLAGLGRESVFIGFSVAVQLAYGWFARPKVRLNRDVTWRSLLLLAPTAIFLLMYAVYALGPETSPDAMDYHLTFADLYRRTGRFVAFKDSYQAGFPQASEMIFLFCDAIGDFRACALSHLLFLAATVPLFLSFGKLIRNGSLGLVAAGLFVMSPVVGIDASTAYNDVALAAYGLGVAYLLALWSRDRDTGTLVLAGALSGMAMATKYTGVITMAGGVLLIFFARGQPVLSRIRRALLYASIGLVPIVPWLVKNALAYGNPLFPFANAWFPNPYIHVDWEIAYTTAMRAFNGVHWYEIPMEVTVKGFRLTGFLGPIFLLAPLVVLSFRMAYARYVLYWLTLWLGVYTASIGARYLISALPFLCLGLASVFTIRPVAGWVVLYLHALLSWPADTAWYCHQYAYRIDPNAIFRAFAYDTPGDYLLTRDTYRIAKLIEATVNPEAVVFSFGWMDRAYSDRRILFVHQSAKALIIQDVLLRGLQKLKIAPVLDCRFPEPVENIEIAGGRTGDSVSISELTAFDRDGVAKPVGVTSNVNPWDVHYLLDGRLVTHWSSWGPVRSVRLTVRGSDIVMLRLAFAGETAPAGWRVSGASERSGGRVVAAGCTAGNQAVSEDLEQTAIQAVKELGITHVLLRTDDSYSAFFAPTIQRHGDLVASEGPFLLVALK